MSTSICKIILRTKTLAHLDQDQYYDFKDVEHLLVLGDNLRHYCQRVVHKDEPGVQLYLPSQVPEGARKGL
jgi:hypothetical protein